MFGPGGVPKQREKTKGEDATRNEVTKCYQCRSKGCKEVGGSECTGLVCACVCVCVGEGEEESVTQQRERANSTQSALEEAKHLRVSVPCETL